MKYLIIGNGVAGMSAAEAIRKKDPEGEIVMLTDERYYHYSRPRVIEFLAGKAGLGQITVRNVEFYRENKIRLVMLVKVSRIDTAARRVFIEGGLEEHYDKLIIAAGADSFLPPVDGAKQAGVFTLRTIDDAKTIMEFAASKKSAAVIGGGLLGIEAAMSLSVLGLKTTVIEMFDRLLPRQLDRDGALILQQMLELKGLSFLLSEQTASIKNGQDMLTVNFKDNTCAEAGVVLFSAGVRPNLQVVQGTGIIKDRGIKVNNFMETNIKDVYACGDVTEYNGMLYCIWPAAREQGYTAGSNAAGEKTEYNGNILSTKLKVAGIDMASLGSIEAGEGVTVHTKSEGGVFKRLFIKDGLLAGAILLGDTGEYSKLQALMKAKTPVNDPVSLFV
ncbi:MAG: FAD-dependent oxidoreductase [Spirochaetia bacterium]|nr:FAD-dependent oxidoreductase [Spirochaetia bacterium]